MLDLLSCRRGLSPLACGGCLVLTHCPELDALTGHIHYFARMLAEREGARLPESLDAVRQDDLPAIHTLTADSNRDRDAVTPVSLCRRTPASSKGSQPHQDAREADVRPDRLCSRTQASLTRA